jgi:hypothetical protein
MSKSTSLVRTLLATEGEHISELVYVYTQVYPILLLCGLPPIPPGNILNYLPPEEWNRILMYVIIVMSIYNVNEREPYPDDPIMNQLSDSIHIGYTSVAAMASSKEVYDVLFDLFNPDSKPGMEGGGAKSKLNSDTFYEAIFGKQASKNRKTRKWRGGMQKSKNGNGNSSAAASSALSVAAASGAAPRRALGQTGELFAGLLPGGTGLGRNAALQTAEQYGMAALQNTVMSRARMRSQLTALSHVTSEELRMAIVNRLSEILESVERDIGLLEQEISLIENKDALDANFFRPANAAIAAARTSASTGAAKNNVGTRRANTALALPSAQGSGLPTLSSLLRERGIRPDGLSTFGQKLRDIVLTATQRSAPTQEVRKIQLNRPTTAGTAINACCATCRYCVIPACSVGAAGATVANKAAILKYVRGVSGGSSPPLTEWIIGGIWRGVLPQVFGVVKGVLWTPIDYITGASDIAETSVNCAIVGAAAASTLTCLYCTGTACYDKTNRYYQMEQQRVRNIQRENKFLVKLHAYTLSAAVKLYRRAITSTIENTKLLFSEPSAEALLNTEESWQLYREHLAKMHDFLRRIEITAAASETNILLGLDRKWAASENSILTNIETTMRNGRILGELSQDEKDWLSDELITISDSRANVQRALKEFEASLQQDEEFIKGVLKTAATTGVGFVTASAQAAMATASSLAGVGMSMATGGFVNPASFRAGDGGGGGGPAASGGGEPSGQQLRGAQTVAVANAAAVVPADGSLADGGRALAANLPLVASNGKASGSLAPFSAGSPLLAAALRGLAGPSEAHSLNNNSGARAAALALPPPPPAASSALALAPGVRSRRGAPLTLQTSGLAPLRSALANGQLLAQLDRQAKEHAQRSTAAQLTLGNGSANGNGSSGKKAV